MKKKELSIIIVTYNSSNYIIDCVKSIYKNIANAFELIVIDNNSTDNTEREIREISSQYDVIFHKNSTNVGFSKACNYGAKISKGNYFLFCNPDTIIENDIFSILSRYLDGNIGCVSPLIKDWTGNETAFAFNFPHNPLMLLHAYFRKILNKLDSRILQINFRNQANVIFCDWVLGACMLFKREHFLEVGGFNENYFMYFEDIDICQKLKSKGLKIATVRDAKVSHKKYGSWKDLNDPNFLSLRKKSKEYYYKSYYGYVGMLISRFFDRNGYLFRS